jgi:hypothetical protein
VTSIDQRGPPIPAVRTERQGSTRSGHPPVLLDDLVGAGEDRLRHGEAERLGRVEVDHLLECRRLLDWEIVRLGALEDLSTKTAASAPMTRRTAKIAM